MQRHVARSTIVRYGSAVLCVTAAVLVALWFRPVTLIGGQLSLVAILITGWVGGLRAAIVAWALAMVAFAYYFTPPLDSFRVAPAELPRFIIFAGLGLFMATVSAARRKAQDALERTRAELEMRVRERTADLERSNDRLQASQEQWRAVFENNPTMYFMVDAAGTIVSVNPIGAEQLGYTVDELVGQSMLKIVHGPDRDAVQRRLADCLHHLGRSLRWELRKVREDGTVLWVRETANAMRRGGGDPVVLVASEDISEQKQADEDRQHRRWVIESMDRVNRAIQGTSDLEQMMSDVLDVALSLFECDRAWLVYPCDPDAVSVRHTMHRARPEFPGLFRVGEEFPLPPDSVAMHRILRAASGPVRFDPESEHPLSTEEAKLFGVQSRMAMALYPKGDLPYMFGLSQCSYARVWTRREEVLFQEIGRRLADALTSLTIFRRLRESEQRYRSIFDSTGVSIWEEDFSQVKAAIEDLRSRGVRDVRSYCAAHPEFVQDTVRMVRIVDVNAASLKLFAAESKDELLISLHKVFVPETQAVFVEELIAIAEGRTSFEAEAMLKTLAGERLTVLLTISFPPPPAAFERVLVTLTDISARRRAEYLTAQVFESAPDRVALVGTDYRFRRVNPRFEQFWGLPPGGGVGMHVADLTGDASFQKLGKPAFDRCFAGEEATWAGWTRTSHGRRYFAISFTPLRPDAERVEAALMISRDLTDHMLAVEELQEARAELAHATRVTTLGELAASIAHEVNQPLAAIVADATASLNWLAAPEPRLDMIREALEAIVKDSHRAGDVIQRVRQLATRSAPRKVRLDLNAVVREVIPLVRAELHRHEVALALDLAADLPPVLGDPVQLQQVLLNLFVNGIEAMAPITDRPRELRIGSARHDADHVTVAVQDTGMGISPEDVDRLFTAFFTTKPSGMGMGLSISQSIIEAHGGRLWATANRPHGTVFQFSLTLDPGAAAGVQVARVAGAVS